MADFKNINYGRMLYEAMRNYFSVNTSGELSWLFKFCAAIVQPLQAPFDAYATARAKSHIIAQCRWQMGQLKNTLNYIYDSTLSRIYITQSVITVISDPEFAYTPVNFDGVFEETPAVINERTFNDRASTSAVIIHIPASIDLDDITATIEQIRVQGIPYQIETF